MRRIGAWLLAAAGCSGGDTTTEPTPGACAEAPGCAIAEDLAAALLSVRAPAPDDVWLVGSPPSPADGTGPVLVHGDGSGWTRVDTSAWADAELWWVWADADEAVAVGSGGTILELDRADDAVRRIDGPAADTTFFGVWGAGADDLWAVGWTEDGSGPPALWRRQGGTWAAYAGSGTGADGEVYYKVHGSSADDAWIVGNGGITQHWDGTAWTRVPLGDAGEESTLLLTVDVGEVPIAVGGSGNGVVLEYDGSAWQDVSPPFQPSYDGVCSGGGATWAVGTHGIRAQRVDGAWVADDPTQVPPLTLDEWHGCAVDGDGGLWTVGGEIASRPLTAGVLGYQGPADPPPLAL